jgi:hypothetical protein
VHIYITRSTDAGQTWGAGVRVDDAIFPNDAFDRVKPTLSVSTMFWRLKPNEGALRRARLEIDAAEQAAGNDVGEPLKSDFGLARGIWLALGGDLAGARQVLSAVAENPPRERAQHALHVLAPPRRLRSPLLREAGAQGLASGTAQEPRSSTCSTWTRNGAPLPSPRKGRCRLIS